MRTDHSVFCPWLVLLWEGGTTVSGGGSSPIQGGGIQVPGRGYPSLKQGVQQSNSEYPGPRWGVTSALVGLLQTRTWVPQEGTWDQSDRTSGSIMGWRWVHFLVVNRWVDFHISQQFFMKYGDFPCKINA